MRFSPRAAGASFPNQFIKSVGPALLLVALVAVAAAQKPTAQPPADRTIAARVDGRPIYVQQVQRELAKTINGRKVEPDAMKIMQSQMVRQLIGRRLIVKYLTRKKQAASGQDIDLAIARIEAQLNQQSLTLEEYLRRSQLEEAEFRDLLTWQISWQRYLDRYLTDENYQRYFEKHRRQFDGTKLRVAHILLKVEPADDPQTVARVLQRAQTIRRDIVDGKTTFAEAAKKYSAAPTAAKGGDIGLIARHEPMTETFSAAAFALEKGKISPPIITPFGVHLIRCLEIKPGQKTWQDVRDQLRLAMTRYLFDFVADREREKSKIEFTTALPHFKPGTTELAD